MEKVTVHIHRQIQVYTSAGYPLIIDEDGDGLGMVTVKCETDYYGKLNFSMEPTTAKAMAEAILEQVKNIESK